MSRILLLEDDLSLIDGLSYSLNKQGFKVDVVRTVNEALSIWDKSQFDLLILDVSLPDGSGFDVCKSVRHISNVPIIFLTASDEEVNMIMGLDIGGDDYITKPFKLGVLISRINALLRRTRNFEMQNSEISSNGITIFLLQGRACKGGSTIELTSVEYKLLRLFMENPELILTKEKILNELWDSHGNYVDDNTLAVYIRRLRTKIEEDPGNPQMITTVRGMGYKWSIASGGVA